MSESLCQPALSEEEIEEILRQEEQERIKEMSSGLGDLPSQ